MFKVTPGAWVEAINAFIYLLANKIYLLNRNGLVVILPSLHN